LSGTVLDSIDWGTKVTPTNKVINVYFAKNGEKFDGETSEGWSSYEKQQAMAAFGLYEDFIDVTFNKVSSKADADFKLVAANNLGYLGYFNPPGTYKEGVGAFATDGTGWNNNGGLEQGGYGFVTLIHEFGHAMGLAHPQDRGGTSPKMHGVTNTYGDYGDFDLNQGVFTTMSYNDGWENGPDGTSPSNKYGWQGSMMALDIALLQQKYGANTSFAKGSTTYKLPDTNSAGTFYAAIWDTGGKDTISNQGSSGDAMIDLRAATLNYENGGGGFISYVKGIYGGFTIANGVKIENATGGAGNDTLIGNGAKNLLKGNNGSDVLKGKAGADTLVGNRGNDKLKGNAGNDNFVFKNNFNKDKVLDFQDNKDTIRLDDNLWNGTKSVNKVLSQFGTQNGSDFVFDFGDGDILTILDVTRSQLNNDIDII
jgi:Ca2+-binding RTX toxin-like protein